MICTGIVIEGLIECSELGNEEEKSCSAVLKVSVVVGAECAQRDGAFQHSNG